jgi:hypothetical protein
MGKAPRWRRGLPTGDSWGYLENRTYVLRDRAAKFCASFRETLRSGGIKPLALPPRSPNLNAFAARAGYAQLSKPVKADPLW